MQAAKCHLLCCGGCTLHVRSCTLNRRNVSPGPPACHPHPAAPHVQEWDAFMATLRLPLPTTFRINGSGRNAEELRAQLENDFIRGLGGEGELVMVRLMG